MELNDLPCQSGEWMKGSGPESDIVISSRIRLARNIAEFPFIRRCGESDRTAINKSVLDRLKEIEALSDLQIIRVDELDDVDKQLLTERQLISREHAESTGTRSVAIDSGERLSVMINEEDHLRIQVMKSGLDLNAAWTQINEVDDQLESKLTFAFHDKLGYLTACPTNVGTGMRVSVMLHLPALVLTQQIEKVFRSLQKINLAVRGLYGEGSQAMGDFYQISNQITLGRSEEELIDQVADVVPMIIEYERRARDFLIEQDQQDLHDKISRAYGILCTAQTISSEETMHLLSSVRMGVNLGLIHDLRISDVNKLFVDTQPAHLQKLRGDELDTAGRNAERAMYLRRYIQEKEQNGGSENN